MRNLEVGHVVRSTAGRDKGFAYLVWGKDGDFVQLVNGKSKRPESPKRKRYKHIQLVDILRANEWSQIQDGVRDGSAASKIRQALKRYCKNTIEMSNHFGEEDPLWLRKM